MGFKNLALAASAVANVAMGGYLLVVQGSASIANRINVSSGTGFIVDVGGTQRFRDYKGTCTNTGGLTTYTTCYVAAPETTTGALLGFSLECSNSVPKSVVGDVSFKASLTAASGSVLTNGNNLRIGSGSYAASTLAQPVVWKPSDYLTYTTLTSPTATPDCQMWAKAAGKYGD